MAGATEISVPVVVAKLERISPLLVPALLSFPVALTSYVVPAA